MAASDLAVVLDEWVRPQPPDLRCPDLDDRQEAIRRYYMAGFITRSEARYLLTGETG